MREGRCPCLYTNPLTWAAVDGEVGSVPRVFTTYGEGEGRGGGGAQHSDSYREDQDQRLISLIMSPPHTGQVSLSYLHTVPSSRTYHFLDLQSCLWVNLQPPLLQLEVGGVVL